MYCNTAYGDYPHFLPSKAERTKLQGYFTGWMLLNYAKPVTASSTLGGFAPNLAVDEDLRTYWSARTGDRGEHFTADLGAVSTVRAIQVNYADHDATLMGKQPGLYHQYLLQASADGVAWDTIVDKSANRSDVPHDYIELAMPVEARYVRIENLHVPTGKFALSGLASFRPRPRRETGAGRTLCRAPRARKATATNRPPTAAMPGLNGKRHPTQLAT